MFDMSKIQKEFDKEKLSLEAKNKAVFSAMKTCPNCKETETKFVPCKTHLDEIKAIGEAMGSLQLQTHLKMQMHPEEVQKVMEAQMTAMMAQQNAQKKGGKADKCTTCCPAHT